MKPDEIINTTKSESVKPEEHPVPHAVSEKSSKKKRSLFDLTDFNKLIGFEGIASNLSFVLFITFLILLYIANNHYALKSVKQLNQSEQQLKQLKWEYVNFKSDLEMKSQQSYIAHQLIETGIKELKQPPVKIYTSTHDKN